MRDTYSADDLHTDAMNDAAKVSTLGMRHSIRPRRTLAASSARPAAQVTPARVTPSRPAAPAVQKTAALRENTEEYARTDSLYLTDPFLPRWHELPQIEAGSRLKSKTAMPVVDAARDSTSVRAFDLLRTRLRQTTQEHGWTNIAISAPTSGCGNTFTAVNLALSLSRIAASRTVLMDFNLRNPGVAKAFDMKPASSMQEFLSGQTPIGDHMVKVSDTLALGLNNRADADASETLQAAETALTLERMRAALQPELVIYDLPPMLTHDDVSAFLPQLDGVLLVSDGSQTMARELMECERMLKDRVPLLGVVLNRARSNSIPHYT